MKSKFPNHARNVWDRAVALLPRVDQFWYKYSYMEVSYTATFAPYGAGLMRKKPGKMHYRGGEGSELYSLELSILLSLGIRMLLWC